MIRLGRLALDRSFVSELVYGPLRHGGSRLADADVGDLATAVARRDGVLVLLTAPASVIRARLLARDGAAAASLADIESLLRPTSTWSQPWLRTCPLSGSEPDRAVVAPDAP